MTHWLPIVLALAVASLGCRNARGGEDALRFETLLEDADAICDRVDDVLESDDEGLRRLELPAVAEAVVQNSGRSAPVRKCGERLLGWLEAELRSRPVDLRPRLESRVLARRTILGALGSLETASAREPFRSIVEDRHADRPSHRKIYVSRARLAKDVHWLECDCFSRRSRPLGHVHAPSRERAACVSFARALELDERRRLCRSRRQLPRPALRRADAMASTDVAVRGLGCVRLPVCSARSGKIGFGERAHRLAVGRSRARVQRTTR